MSSPPGTSPPTFPIYSPSPSPPPLHQQQQQQQQQQPEPQPEPPSPNSTIPSLPSSPTISTASSSQDSDDNSTTHPYSDAEREWSESLQQMELLLTLVAVPYLGKYFGRRCAYWAWARFMTYKYPDLEIAVTSKAAFKGAGAVEAAASL